MFDRKWVTLLLCVAAISLSASGAMGANVLFLYANDEAMQPGDDALKAFIEGMGHTVTYLDDDASAADTLAAAEAADLVFVSESVGSAKVQNEITAAETPIVTVETWAYEEMGLSALGTGEGVDVATTDIEIVKPDHPLAAGLSGTVTVFTDITGGRGTARLGSSVAGSSATVIARATLSNGGTYDIIYVYEKGAVLPTSPADGSPQKAAGIRVCFGFDELGYLLWTDDAYTLFGAAINFGLGIRFQPEAYSPSPSDGETEVARDATLSWRRGVYAATHDVYFGTDFNDVNAATVDDPRGVLLSTGKADLTCDPGFLLDYGQTYYWRVDEVNAPANPGSYRGAVWSFTTLNFIVIDDFERYLDDEPDRVFDTWKDGWGTDDNGGVAGYAEPDWEANEHYVETLIVHGGEQSMPFFYNNDNKYSEAAMALPESLKDWTQADVNSLVLWYRGYAAYVGGFADLGNNSYEVTGAGADIWTGSDEFHFAYKEITSGNCTIIAKVESLEELNKDSKAGIMIRDSLDPGATNTALLLTPDPNKGLRFQNRTTAGGATVRGDPDMDPNAMVPYWLKIERTSGGLVRGYRSPNGADWTRFDLKTVTMQFPIYVGLAVTSHVLNTPCTAQFSNVTITGTGSEGEWADADVGITTNAPQPMYVVVNDSAVVYSDNPAATNSEGWMEWTIPLSAFAEKGVDLGSVESLGIGVGTRGDTTQAGGNGQLFFDDFRLYRPEQ